MAQQLIQFRVSTRCLDGAANMAPIPPAYVRKDLGFDTNDALAWIFTNQRDARDAARLSYISNEVADSIWTIDWRIERRRREGEDWGDWTIVAQSFSTEVWTE